MMKRLIKYLDAPRGTVIALTIAVLVAGVLLANVLFGHAWTIEERTRRASGEAIATQTATALAAYIDVLRAHAGDRARTAPALRACTGRGDDRPSHCGPDGFPGLDSVQFVPLGPLGIAASDFSPASLHNNREASLVGAIFSTGTAGAEAFDADGRALLVVAVKADAIGDAPAGVLLARAALDTVLADVLRPRDVAGEFSFHAAGADAPLARAGTGAADGADLYRVDTPVASLQAGFRPDEAFLAATSVSAMSLLLPVLGGTAVVALLVLFGFRQLQMQLRADVAKLTDMTLYQRASTMSSPVLNYGELEPLAAALVQMRRDAAEAASHRRSREEGRSRAVAATEMDALDIEVVEDDSIPPPPPPEDPDALIPAEVFRDYDVRGQNSLLRPELAFALGQAVGSEALERDCRTLIVGADGRETSPMLREQLLRGLLSTGIDVVDVGTVATPMLYFACHALGTLSGIMVTGSHHPADHNGFKIMLGGETLCGGHISALRTRILEKRFAEGAGSYRSTSINEDYRRAICDDVLVDRPLKVIVDCGNGAASVVAVELLQDLGCDVTALFCELDGRFPNHAPDPSVPSNLRQLLSEVSARHADLGIAFDGDGDRIGVVTSTGRIVTADRLMMLFAHELLSRHPGADIVFDVKCSRDLATEITRHGGRPIMWRSGHSWIKEKMKETGALLGGEFTGHICFKDRWYGFDDALYCAARLLEILSADAQPLDALLESLPRAIATPEIHIRVQEPVKFALMERVAAQLDPEGARLMRIDGVRAEFQDGWALVRASNTSASLTLRFEGRDERALARIQGLFRDELRRILPECEIPF